MRTCEQCGTKVPFGVKRRRVGDKLVCDGCLNGRPGMPRTQITRRTAGVFDAITSVQGQSIESRVGAFPLKKGHCYVLELAPLAGQRMVVAMLTDTVVMGQLDWGPDGKIGQLYVEPRFRRAGVATALLAAARQLDPSVHHSSYLTDDGAAFSQAVAMKNPLLSRRVTRHVLAEFPPKKDDSGSAPPPKAKGMPGQPPAMPPAGMPPMGMDPMDPMGMGQPSQPQQPQFAPDQQSDLVVRVCPFCGSGHLIGASDGSISCGYCDADFTITVMPSHPFQPLVNPKDGSPFTMPTDPDADPNPQIGTAAPENSPGEGPADPTAQTPAGQPDISPSLPPSDPGDDDLLRQGDPSSPGALDAAFEQVVSGAAAMAAPVPEDAAKPGQAPTPIPGAPPQLDGDAAPDEDGVDDEDDEDDEKKKSAPPWAKKSSAESRFVTAAGTMLDEDAYVDHLRRTVLHGGLPERVARLAQESLD